MSSLRVQKIQQWWDAEEHNLNVKQKQELVALQQKHQAELQRLRQMKHEDIQRIQGAKIYLQKEKSCVLIAPKKTHKKKIVGNRKQSNQK